MERIDCRNDQCHIVASSSLTDEHMEEADTLRTQFERSFWCDDLSSYALALDGFKQPCRVKMSNAGHCLWTWIADEKHGMRTAKTLVGDEFF